MTADIFPSYILEPKKILDMITWFLNPIEKPPQKFLQILPKDIENNIYSDLLEKEGYIIKNISEKNLIGEQKVETNDTFEEGWFNLIFSLANDQLPANFEQVSNFIHDLLKKDGLI